MAEEGRGLFLEQHPSLGGFVAVIRVICLHLKIQKRTLNQQSHKMLVRVMLDCCNSVVSMKFLLPCLDS